MKALGYILIVLVIIAGGCFIYFGTGVLVERQKWSSAVFRHDLAIHGLPVEKPSAEMLKKFEDTTPQDPTDDKFPFAYRLDDDTGEIEWVSRSQLEDIFLAADANKAKSPVDGGPVLKGDAEQGKAALVTSQVEEVERVQGIITGMIQRTGATDRKLNLLSVILLALADTNPERDYVLALHTKLQNGTLTNADLEAAERKVQGHFEYALASTPEEVKQAVRKIEGLTANQDLTEVSWVRAAIQVEDAQRIADGGAAMETSEAAAFVEKLFPKPGEIDKRQRIADVLFNVGRAVNVQPADELSWQQRVIVVVGLEEYVKVVTTKATALSDIAARLRVEITQEEADFRSQYPRLVATSRALAIQLADWRRQVAVDEREMLANQELRDQRSREVLALTGELDRTTKLAGEALDQQSVLEKQLFDTQVKLGAALEAIVRLEDELRELELGDEGR